MYVHDHKQYNKHVHNAIYDLREGIVNYKINNPLKYLNELT